MNTPIRRTKLSRRRFLSSTAVVAAAAPTILKQRVFGQEAQVAASERITMGIIGAGWQGGSNLQAFLNRPEVQVVAVSDLDEGHMADAVKSINSRYNSSDCKTYHDYRELLARKDIDAVMIATPDHWHALTAVEAANQGKHIYGEKPLARTIREQQAIVYAVQKAGVIWQTGSWQRSQRNFRYGAEIVRNGLIGKIQRVEVGLPSGHADFAGTRNKTQITEPPPQLDYNFWIGPSKMEPYIEARVHKNWRWNYNTGGGQLLDWIGHHCDIAHWGMDCDNSGPLEVDGTGDFPPKDAVWNTATKYYINALYPNDIKMVIAGGYSEIRQGTKWIGTDGWVWVNRNNAFESSNPEWEDTRELPEDVRKVKLYESRDHFENFAQCVLSGKPTVTPVEVAHHSAIPGHLGLIAMMEGRKIKWDSEKEVIIDDPAASKLLTRDYREPWVMPAA